MAAAALHDATDMGPVNNSMSVEPQSGAVGNVEHVAWGPCPRCQPCTDLSGAGNFLGACSSRGAPEPQARKGQWKLLHAHANVCQE